MVDFSAADEVYGSSGNHRCRNFVFDSGMRSLLLCLINNVFQKKFVGLENFLEILSNPYFLLALKNTNSYVWTFSFFDAFAGNDSVYPCGFFGWKIGGFSLILLVPLFMPSVLSVEIVEMFGGSWSPRMQLLAFSSGAIQAPSFSCLPSVCKVWIENYWMRRRWTERGGWISFGTYICL